MSAEFESGAGRKPFWHRLGKVVGRAMTAKEAIVEGGLDWAVEKQRLYAMFDGDLIETTVFANFRMTDHKQVSDGISEEYRTVQNVEVFNLLDAVVDSGEAHYEAVTSLYGGRVITLTAGLNREVRMPGGTSEVVPYIHAVNSHDGSHALTILPGDNLIVCANTLRLALGKARFGRYTLRHVGDVQAGMAEIREAVGLTMAYYDAFEDEVERLVNQRVAEDEVERLLADLFPSKKDGPSTNHYAVRGILDTVPYVKPWRDTAWGFLNAVNELELWHGNGDSERVAERQSRLVLASGGLPKTGAAHKALVAARS